MVVDYKENGQQKTKYYIYISEQLKHDAVFVNDCFSHMLEQNFFRQFTKFELWADNGRNFRSSYFYHLLFSPSSYISKFGTFSMNFFGEKHGKSKADQFFGLFSRYLSKQKWEFIIQSVFELFRRLIKWKFIRGKEGQLYDIEFFLYDRFEGDLSVGKLLIVKQEDYLCLKKIDNLIIGQLFTDELIGQQDLECKNQQEKWKVISKKAPIKNTNEKKIFGDKTKEKLLSRLSKLMKCKQ